MAAGKSVWTQVDHYASASLLAADPAMEAVLERNHASRLPAIDVSPLQGLKENVIVGRLIPAGTGGAMSQIRRIATSRDDLIIDERRKQANAEIAEPMLTDMTNAAE